MTLRQEFERREANFMSPFGCLSARSRGRVPEADCPIRTVFQVDKDRILYSNAFRASSTRPRCFSTHRATNTAPA
jgi:dGTPase